MTVANDIQHLIAEGQFEYSLEKSNQFFQQAIKLAEESAKSLSNNYIYCLLGKEAYRELALNELRPSLRSTLWQKALNALKWIEPEEQHQFVLSYAELAVDFCQDEFAEYSKLNRLNLLKKAKQTIEAYIDVTKIDQLRAEALAKKSSIIRLQAIGIDSNERLRMLSEAYRCAYLARTLSNSAPILLECALIEWALARLQDNDKKYINRLLVVENLLKSDAVKKFSLGAFVLSRFYRLTCRYYDACTTFPILTESSIDRRRILRNASIYAESAIQLVNLNYPEVVLEEHLDNAVILLETAISSGCYSARDVIALAYIRCLRDGVPAGVTALADLKFDRGEVSWEQVLSFLTELKDADLPSQGFALGISDSSALTRLGTFSNRFLHNNDLAEALYRAAVRLNSHDPIAQTNLARFLVKRGNPADLREAERIIQLAQSFADRRFSWWRPVLIALNSQKIADGSQVKNGSEVAKDLLRPFSGAQHFRQIRQHYNRLKNYDNEQQRGYELERLIYSVALLSFGYQRPSYRMSRPLVDKVHQIDALIEHRGKSYRCECKWQTTKVSYDDMLKFIDKVDAAGVSGLFVSISGFMEGAINKSREERTRKAIILVDGDEIELVMTGTVQFDDLLTAKRRAFDATSETYHQIRVVPSDG